MRFLCLSNIANNPFVVKINLGIPGVILGEKAVPDSWTVKEKK